MMFADYADKNTIMSITTPGKHETWIRRRWPNIDLTSDPCLVFAGLFSDDSHAFSF